ncbi:CDP-alcohol phosphatidyltransferase [Calothrix sp. NIES-4101]|nr:CDP-alcohol phosphatidyltransferase [Calothrix sp. NIES-4101]
MGRRDVPATILTYMNSLYQLKPTFQNKLRPLVNRIASIGVTANQVTIFATILSTLVGIAITLWNEYHWLLLIVPPVMLIRMALNAIDGMLAREHGMKSIFGGILNELTDVISDAVLYLPFAVIPHISSYLVVVVVILSIISEMAGVLGVVAGGSRRYDGPMGKSDRAFIFALISLLLGFGIVPGIWLDIIFTLTIALLAGNIFNRVRNTLIELENR